MNVLHQLVMDDGTTQVTLEPPAWREMTYSFSRVETSSIFESITGAAKKQRNAGATVKRNIRVNVSGRCAPPMGLLNPDITWTITMISPTAIEQTAVYTVWYLGDIEPTQTINVRQAERVYTLEFREE